jgi:membrane protease YdiL (CAAX protease family)
MGFVLGWLTLRTGSVLPAAVAHSLKNALVLSLIESKVPWEGTAIVLLWLFLAVVLFRFWPIRSEDAVEQTPQATSDS